MRTTKRNLQGLVNLLNARTGDSYILGYAHGQYRLERKSKVGTIDISPRLSTGELYRWIQALLIGMEIAWRNGRT